MSKGKLQKFAEMETFNNVFQYPYGVISEVPFDMKGHWREQYFTTTTPSSWNWVAEKANTPWGWHASIRTSTSSG